MLAILNRNSHFASVDEFVDNFISWFSWFIVQLRFSWEQPVRLERLTTRDRYAVDHNRVVHVVCREHPIVRVVKVHRRKSHIAVEFKTIYQFFKDLLTYSMALSGSSVGYESFALPMDCCQAFVDSVLPRLSTLMVWSSLSEYLAKTQSRSRWKGCSYLFWGC